MSTKQPASQRAEEAVIGALLRSDEARTEVIGSGLEEGHFFYRPYRLAFEEIVERYFSDDPIDPLTIGEAVGPAVAKAWGIEEREAVDRIRELTKIDSSDLTSTAEHARIIKKHADYRELLNIASSAVQEAIEQDRDPGEIAGVLGAAATRVVTGTLRHGEWLSFSDLGRRWTKHTQTEIAAKASGMELGAYFGVKGIDDYVKGMRPTELMMLGGEPGVGKSAIAWMMARNFAYRQLRKPADRRIGTAIFSLEMGEEISSSRFAQIESRVEGERLRSVQITREELREIAQKWAANRELPLWVNHSGRLRQSQIKAMCVEAIRRHQVGLVIIDHFRFIQTDERFENRTEADDEVVAFLKGLAKDLNLAIICLAHTTKGDGSRRPVMDDLRGSGMISAFADLVVFPYWPWKHASQEKRERGVVGREEYELIWDKVRSAAPGTGELWMDLSTMAIS